MVARRNARSASGLACGGLALTIFAVSAAGCDGLVDGEGGQAGSGGSTTTSEGGAGGATTSSSTTTTTAPLTCNVPISSVPLSGECDMLLQDCSPGETCVPGPNNKTFCAKGGGLKSAGKPCKLVSGVNECQAGLFCIGASEIGICTRPCCPTTDEPCEGGDCNGKVDFGSVVIDMCSYQKQCELFTEGTCPTGQKCQLVYPNQGLAVCTLPAPNDVGLGEPCEFVNECGASQVCSIGICRYNCLLSAAPGTPPGEGGCPDMQSCAAAYPPEAGDVGICQ